jgi:hydroxymethylpyrimidine pyrophosphatase-like HAD family hydrolase
MAIISDFDGTLCPTSSCVNHYDDKSYNLIPPDLEDILYNISKSMPICIISSKDFYFLYEKIRKFSSILSCILGMETLFLDSKDKDIDNNNTTLSLTDNIKIDDSQFSIIDNKYSIVARHLLIDNEVLLNNSAILKEIVNYFEIKYPMINIEKKFLTINEGILGGITIDWRNDSDWNTNRKRYERIVKKSLFNVYKKPSNLQLSKSHFYYYLQKFFVQNYTTHPFIDIYSTKISKGDAYDCIISELFKLNYSKGKIIYLGDSENDNSAFKKADISIGINSDTRLKPDLKCKYNLKYENLSIFLKNLANNNFEFSDSLLSF